MKIETFATVNSGLGIIEKGLIESGLTQIYHVNRGFESLKLSKTNSNFNKINHNLIELQSDKLNLNNLPEVDLLWITLDNIYQDYVERKNIIKVIIDKVKSSKFLIIENFNSIFTCNDANKLRREVYPLNVHAFTVDNTLLNLPCKGKTSLLAISDTEFKFMVDHDDDKQLASNHSWFNAVKNYQNLWQKSRLLDSQLAALDYHCCLFDDSNPTIAIERKEEMPLILHRGCSFSPITPERSFFDFVYAEESYCFNKELLSVLKGFPTDFNWGAADLHRMYYVERSSNLNLSKVIVNQINNNRYSLSSKVKNKMLTSTSL